MANALLEIEIAIDPEITEIVGLLLTWHGVFTAVGIAIGVYAAVLIGRRMGFLDDDIYGAALVAIPAGIVGARALFVAENWGEGDLDSVIDILRVNEGGISIYGAVIGGYIGGLAYGWFRKMNLLRALDGASFGLILGMAIGRLGDIINGEHFAESSGLPWAVKYTHINSPSVLSHPQCGLDPLLRPTVDAVCAQHPAVAYEMLGDLMIFGLLFLVWRLLRRDGTVFFSLLLLYSAMRFAVSELRIDSDEVFAGLTTPQVTALCIIPISVVGLVWTYLRGPSGDEGAYMEGATLPGGDPATGPPARAR